MIIQPSMDPATPHIEHSQECISFFYQKAIEAATVTSLEEAQRNAEWCSDIQSQVIKLVEGLSTRQYIHREINGSTDGGCDLEFVESDYSDLIGFLSEVGTAVGDMAGRLRNAKGDIQEVEFRAGLNNAQR